MFRHPKYYKELRKLRNKLDQVISSEAGDGERERAPDPGLKQQATSAKLQAPSRKLQVPRSLNHGKVSRYLNQGPLP